MPCEQPITEGAARSLYARFLATQGADGCTLDEVATEHTQMRVVWTKQGSALPAAEIVRAGCASPDALVGPTLAMRIPEPLRAACPATVGAAIGVVQHETFEVAASRITWRPVAAGAAGVAIAAALFTVVMVLRHRPIVTPSPES